MAKATKPVQLSNDDRAARLIEIVNQKKAAIAQAERPTYLTNLSFSPSENGSTDRINLNVITEPKHFVSILAVLREKENAFNSAANELGLSDVTFQWQGYSVEDWKADLVTRLNKVQINKRKDELKVLEAKVNALISPEKRAQMELDALEAEIGS